MTISVSTATCERGFSKLNIEKTPLRRRMNSQMLSDVMRIGITSTSLEDINPETVLTKWLEGGPARSHLIRHKTLLKSRFDEHELVEPALGFIIKIRDT